MIKTRLQANDLTALIKSSLTLWQVTATVQSVKADTLSITTPLTDIQINRADDNEPFRWVITTHRRRRTANSVTGLLRHLRLECDVDYQPARLQFAANAPDPDATQ